MGLLDDAIREHLELKRRHGADPGELDQQAEDALGPPSREVPAAPAAASSSDAPPAARRPLEDEGWGDEDDEPLPPVPASPSRAQEPAHGGSIAVPPPARPRDEPLADPERTRAFSLEEEREAVQPPAPPARAHRRIDAPDEDATPDELERTPEFLEDTPEHDRLWFEQRPPKDFDF